MVLDDVRVQANNAKIKKEMDSLVVDMVKYCKQYNDNEAEQKKISSGPQNDNTKKKLDALKKAKKKYSKAIIKLDGKIQRAKRKLK